MGKSNRIRTQRAEAAVKNPLKQNNNKKKGAPSWLYSVIALVITVAVLATVVVNVVSANGTLMRARKAIKTENYTITGTMMEYLFHTQYANFQSNYSSMLSTFSLDTSKSLKSQQFGDTEAGMGYEVYYLGEFEGTWFDYFAKQAEESAKYMLIFCEEANARGIKLEAEENEYIDGVMNSLSETAATYGYSIDGYLAAAYGKGIKAKDVRRVMELDVLSSKCQVAIAEEIDGAITSEQINQKYQENKESFDVVDYVYYTVTVKYDEVKANIVDTGADDAAILEAYKNKVDEAKSIVNKLSELTSVQDIEKAIYTEVANKKFDNLYNSENLATEDKLSDAAYSAVKTAMVNKVIEEVMGGQQSSDDTNAADGVYTIYEQTVTEKAATALDNVKEDLFDEVENAKDTYVVKGETHKNEDELSEWLFADERQVGHFKTEIEGDGADANAEFKNEKGALTASFYYVTAPRYCDKTLSKNVSYMTFEKKEDAQAAIDAFKAGEITLEAFEALANDKGAHEAKSYKNYLEGDSTMSELEDWLYADGTVVGSYNAEPVEMEDSEHDHNVYAVFFYSGDGEEAWYIDAKDTIYTENYTEFYTALQERIVPVVNAKVLAKIDA